MDPIHIEISIDQITDSQVEQSLRKISELTNKIAAHYLLDGKRSAADPVIQSIMTVAMHSEGVAKYLKDQSGAGSVLSIPKMVMGQRPS